MLYLEGRKRVALLKPWDALSLKQHTTSGAWQVASIANTASKVSFENGIFMKSA